MGRSRRVVHLSDLHFGRTRPELLEPLITAVNAQAPDLVAVSGDLTQRARTWQFEAARAFLDRIDAPRLVVPGNHDVPLDNLPVRLFRPFGRYRRWIGSIVEPCYRDEAMVVLGLNTVNPLSWQRGRLPSRVVRRACVALGAERDGLTRIIVAHHPFEQLPDVDKALMHGASRAIDAFLECGADIVLSGHLHTWRAEPFAARRGPGGAILQIQAGTGLSTRLRGEENDFNLLTLETGAVTVTRFVARAETAVFEPAAAVRFDRGPKGWMRPNVEHAAGIAAAPAGR